MQYINRQDNAYPAQQLFGAQRNSMPTGTAPNSGSNDVTKNHLVFTGLALIALAYIAWHYVMTH